MSREPRLWSQRTTLFIGMGFTPLSSVVLQALNFRQLGLDSEFRRCCFWFVGLLALFIAVNLLPLPLSTRNWGRTNMMLSLTMLWVWYFLHGRHFESNVGAGHIGNAIERHPFTAVLVGVATLAGLVIGWNLLTQALAALGLG